LEKIYSARKQISAYSLRDILARNVECWKWKSQPVMVMAMQEEV
jgi:hypothetical protein